MPFENAFVVKLDSKTRKEAAANAPRWQLPESVNDEWEDFKTRMVRHSSHGLASDKRKISDPVTFVHYETATTYSTTTDAAGTWTITKTDSSGTKILATMENLSQDLSRKERANCPLAIYLGHGNSFNGKCKDFLKSGLLFSSSSRSFGTPNGESYRWRCVPNKDDELKEDPFYELNLGGTHKLVATTQRLDVKNRDLTPLDWRTHTSPLYLSTHVDLLHDLVVSTLAIMELLS